VVSSTPRSHFTPRKDPVPILQEAGWAPGPVCTGGKSRPHRDSIPGRPARSQSLYRLSYPAHRSNIVELHISGLTGTVSHPDMQKIRITGVFFENRLHWQSDDGCYFFYITICTVPVSKPLDHASFDVQGAITLYCT